MRQFLRELRPGLEDVPVPRDEIAVVLVDMRQRPASVDLWPAHERPMIERLRCAEETQETSRPRQCGNREHTAVGRSPGAILDSSRSASVWFLNNHPRELFPEVAKARIANPVILVSRRPSYVQHVSQALTTEFGPTERAMIMIPGGA